MPVSYTHLFHNDFIAGHVTLVGCPKLDAVDYSEKLTEILRRNEIQSVTVVRMEVPCCGCLLYTSSLDVLYLGSSYAYCDINPSLIYAQTGLTGFVLAGSEQPLSITYWYLRCV